MSDLRCDLSNCRRPAEFLVHFKNVGRAYPYCYEHATLYGSVEKRFGRYEGSGVQRRWVTAVRHVQRVTPKGKP